MSAPLFVESGRATYPVLDEAVAAALADAVLRAPGVSALSLAGRSQVVDGVVYACRAYLAERALHAGTRSAEVLDRLSVVHRSAVTLLEAVRSLDGVAWGHLMRALREGEAWAPVAGKLEGVQDLLACLKGFEGALAGAVDAAREGPAAHPEHARLLMAARVGVALERAGIALVTTSAGTYEHCARAAFSAVGLEQPGANAGLLGRAIKVVRRHGG